MNRNTVLARNLRKYQTPQEKKLWNLLRNHRFYGYEFRRQYCIGNYIVDFICREKKIVIELDGGQHNEPEHIKYDNERTAFLVSKGFKVISFWNKDINENIDGIYEQLLHEFVVES